MAEDTKDGIEYGSDSIRTLDWKEHIRRRPGMYIGKLGDGTHADDGIYVLLKEVIDNTIDEYMMGYGKQVIVDIEDDRVSVRDYGRGIPLDKVVDVSSKMNTGAKYDSKAFKKSVGLNGVGIKAVNALSSEFRIESYRDGECKSVTYASGNKVEESAIIPTDQNNGTWVCFKPDDTIFVDYKYREEFVVALIKNYTYLNSGLTFIYNGVRYTSKNGLVDLLNEKMTATPLYPMIHLKGDDIEVVITHNTEVLAYDGKEIYTCPIKARNLSGRTGRGDTTFAGYIAERQRGSVEEALNFCTALVSLKMVTPVPFKGTREDVLAYMKEYY